MYKCQCEREFGTLRALSIHKTFHKEKEGPRYSKSRARLPKDSVKCKGCGKEIVITRGRSRVYCNNFCQGLHNWEVSKKEISEGVRSANRRYVEETIGPNCSECGLTPTWNGKKLVMQLDHIDGNSDNNSIDNLRLLCPNCHTQTETWGAKGFGSTVKKETKRNSYLRKMKNGHMVRAV